MFVHHTNKRNQYVDRFFFGGSEVVSPCIRKFCFLHIDYISDAGKLVMNLVEFGYEFGGVSF